MHPVPICHEWNTIAHLSDRTSKDSQPSSLTVIKYVSRNSTAVDHGMTLGRTKRQVT